MRLNRVKELIAAYEAVSRIDRHDMPFKFAEAASNFFNEYGVDAYYMLVNELKVLEGIKEVRKETKALAKQCEKSAEVLKQDIFEVGFTSKTGNLLRGLGVDTVSDLLKYTEVEILKEPNVGIKTLNEVKNFLAQHGFYLGMTEFAATE